MFWKLFTPSTYPKIDNRVCLWNRKKKKHLHFWLASNWPKILSFSKPKYLLLSLTVTLHSPWMGFMYIVLIYMKTVIYRPTLSKIFSQSGFAILTRVTLPYYIWQSFISWEGGVSCDTSVSYTSPTGTILIFQINESFVAGISEADAFVGVWFVCSTSATNNALLHTEHWNTKIKHNFYTIEI